MVSGLAVPIGAAGGAALKAGTPALRAMVVEGGKICISGAAGEAASEYVYNKTDNKTLSMIFGMSVGGLTYGGMTKIDKVANVSGLNPKVNVVNVGKGDSGAGGSSSSDEAYKYYMELAEKLDVSTAKNTATFYSGPGNRELAEAFAKANGKTTLEMTAGGQYLDDLKLFADGSPLSKEQAANVWKKLSERYARGASGNAYGFAEGSWEGSIFNTVEYPALKNNQNISNVFTELFKNGGN